MDEDVKERLITLIPELDELFSYISKLENKISYLESKVDVAIDNESDIDSLRNSVESIENIIDDYLSGECVTEMISEEITSAGEDFEEKLVAVSADIQGQITELENQIVELHLLGPDLRRIKMVSSTPRLGDNLIYSYIEEIEDKSAIHIVKDIKTDMNKLTKSVENIAVDLYLLGSESVNKDSYQMGYEEYMELDGKTRL